VITEPLMNCPCATWCRTDIRFKDGKPLPTTNHHPNCPRVDDSLMDVWEVVIPGEEHGCVVDDERAAREMAAEDPDEPLEVRHRRMHREVYEALGEFAGF
jgi:hypothetical protein